MPIDPADALRKSLSDWQIQKLADALDDLMHSPAGHGELTITVVNHKVRFLKQSLSTDISDKTRLEI